MFTGLPSFRTARSSELIRFGASSSRVRLDFYREEREQQAELEISRQPSRKRFFVNGVSRQSGREDLGFYMVLFTPDDLRLLKAGPSQRRELLDTVLCQLYPRYEKNLSEYQRCLVQRNTLLKSLGRDPGRQNQEKLDFLEVLDAALAKLGVYLIRERAKITQRLAFHAGKMYERISGGAEILSVCYQSGAFPATVRRETGEFSVYREETAENGEQMNPQDAQMLEAQRKAILISDQNGLALSFYQLLQSRRKADLGAGFTTAGPIGTIW